MNSSLEILKELLILDGKFWDSHKGGSQTLQLVSTNPIKKDRGGLIVSFLDIQGLSQASFFFSLETGGKTLRISKPEELEKVANELNSLQLKIEPETNPEEILKELKAHKNLSQLDAALEKYHLGPFSELNFNSLACTLRSRPALALELIQAMTETK